MQRFCTLAWAISPLLAIWILAGATACLLLSCWTAHNTRWVAAANIMPLLLRQMCSAEPPSKENTCSHYPISCMQFNTDSTPTPGHKIIAYTACSIHVNWHSNTNAIATNLPNWKMCQPKLLYPSNSCYCVTHTVKDASLLASIHIQCTYLMTGDSLIQLVLTTHASGKCINALTHCNKLTRIVTVSMCCYIQYSMLCTCSKFIRTLLVAEVEIRSWARGRAWTRSRHQAEMDATTGWFWEWTFTDNVIAFWIDCSRAEAASCCTMTRRYAKKSTRRRDRNWQRTAASTICRLDF